MSQGFYFFQLIIILGNFFRGGSMVGQQTSRVYYYEPNPKFVFESIEEKRLFKERVKRSLFLLGYYRDRDFLRDIYGFLERQDLEGLVEHFKRRLEEAKHKEKG